MNGHYKPVTHLNPNTHNGQKIISSLNAEQLQIYQNLRFITRAKIYLKTKTKTKTKIKQQEKGQKKDNKKIATFRAQITRDRTSAHGRWKCILKHKNKLE